MKKRQPPNRSLSRRSTTPAPVASADRLLGDIRSPIETARQQVARIVDATMGALYWHVGKRIREEILGGQRAEYGEQIVQTLSGQLALEHGRGFGRRNLCRMMQFAQHFPMEGIMSALSAQSGWSHFVENNYDKGYSGKDLWLVAAAEQWPVFTEKRRFTT